MSIKSEIRLIENKFIPVKDSNFKSDGLDNWTGATYGSSFKHSKITNSVKSVDTASSSEDDRTLKQMLPYDYDKIAATPFKYSKPIRVDYKVYNIKNPGETEYTFYLGNLSGTTRTENGDYFDIFYGGLCYTPEITMTYTGDTLYYNIEDEYQISGVSINENYGDYEWITDGTGTFSSGLNPTYTPSVTDENNSGVTLTLSLTGNCEDEFDTANIELTLDECYTPTVYAGPDYNISGDMTIYLSGATVDRYESLLWTTDGHGTFDDDTILHPTYTPSYIDYDNTITITLTVQGTCFLQDIDSLQATIGFPILNKIYIGGEFTRVNGNSPMMIAKLNEDGSLDNNFTGYTYSASDSIHAIEEYNGNILVGGDFSLFNDDQGMHNMVMIEKDGSVVNAGSINSGYYFSDRVNCIRKDEYDMIYVGGFFDYVTDSAGNHNIEKLAKIDSGGTYDQSFDIGKGFVTSDSVSVDDISIDSSDRVYAGGNIEFFYPSTTFDGLMRFNADGSVSGTFNIGNVEVVLVEPDDKIIIAGRDFYGKRINPDGSLDEDLSYLAPLNTYCVARKDDGGLYFGGSFSGCITGPTAPMSFTHSTPSLARVLTMRLYDNDQKLAVGGYFDSYNGTPVQNFVIINTNDGSILSTFNPPVLGGGSSDQNPVWSILVNREEETNITPPPPPPTTTTTTTLSDVSIGDDVYGGVIIYILQPGDIGYVSGEEHGIVSVLPDDIPPGINYTEFTPDQLGYKWGCDQITLGIPDREIGTGKQNTIDILNSCSQPDIAAEICDNFTGGGYTDWFLPSRDEMSKIINLSGFTSYYDNDGRFKYNDYYFTSTENSSGYSWIWAWTWYIECYDLEDTGSYDFTNSDKSYPRMVLPMRYF